MSKRRPTPTEIRFLQESLSAGYEISSIRLREGEYQFNLANAIALFQLELSFPDVKDIIKRLFGEEKINDIQFIRKIQTILKKMEKSNVVKILPKKNPWDLQRYALTSFKFQDADKNLIVFATDQQIKQAQDMLRFMVTEQKISTNKPSKIRIFALMAMAGVSYLISIWSLLQPMINPLIFVPAFSGTAASSIVLGKILSQT